MLKSIYYEIDIVFRSYHGGIKKTGEKAVSVQFPYVFFTYSTAAP